MLRNTEVMTPGPLTDDDVRALGEQGYFIKDHWLGEDRAHAALAAAKELRREGILARAGVGRGADRTLNEDIRGDEIAWITEASAPSLRELFAAFESLRAQMNELAFLGLRRFDVQLACYPGRGERYVRHKDAFGVDDNRRLTAILYLNPAYRSEHGGALRLHLEQRTVDVAPELDRLVVFTSARIEHEVLPSHRERWAATAWYYARER